MKYRFPAWCGGVLAATCALTSVAAHAQANAAGDFPNRPVRIVVPYAPGAGIDQMARAIAQKLTEKWGQPVIVENKAGAAGNLGTQQVVNSPPDGYTLVTGTVSNTISTTLFKNLGFDFSKDLAPVTQIANTPLGLFANLKTPFNDVPGLIDYAKRNPGKLNFGSGGNGSSTHLSGELLKEMAGVSLIHVPYKSATAALVDLMGGQIELMFDTVTAQLSNVNAGKLKLIAVTSTQRMRILPQVPTIAETLPGFDAMAWQGFNVPAATPKAIVEKLNRDIAAIIQSPEMKERFAASGAELIGNSASEYGVYIRRETTKWATTIKASGATAE